MAAYLNFFEFYGYVPQHLLADGKDGEIEAMLRISPRDREWRFDVNSPSTAGDTIAAIAERAERVLAASVGVTTMSTITFESDAVVREALSEMGYVEGEREGICLSRSLVDGDGDIEELYVDDVEIRLALPTTKAELRERAGAQREAFSGKSNGPDDWSLANLRRIRGFRTGSADLDVMAVGDGGRVLSFAGIILEPSLGVGEFEPVGTRRSAQRRGYGRAVMLEGLRHIQACGLEQAVVRTDPSNKAAVALYESVGFEPIDYIVRSRRG